MEKTKINISNAALSGAFAGYKSVSKEKVHGKLVFALAKLGAKLRTAMITYEESQKTIVNNHAEKGEDGQPLAGDDGQGIRINKGSVPAFTEDMKQLDLSEVTLEVELVESTELEKYSFEPGAVEALLPFIKL